MTRQEAIELLEPLIDEAEYLNIILVMGRKSVTEICSHYGTWNDFEFTCNSRSYWRTAEVETEMDTDELYRLLVGKDLSEMDDTDFSYMSLGEAQDASTDVTDVDWTEETPDDEFLEDNDFDEMDLYMDSEIGDCEIEFSAGGVEAIKFNIGGTDYIIE